MALPPLRPVSGEHLVAAATKLGVLNKPCVSTIALLPSSKAPEAAREFIKFISSPRAAPLLRKTLVEPANP